MPLAKQERHQLADALRRRGMRRHLQLLLSRRLGPDLELEWLRLLHVPPHEANYPILPRGAPCPRCGDYSENRTATGTFVPFSFPGGWAERCVACHSTWVHVEGF